MRTNHLGATRRFGRHLAPLPPMTTLDIERRIALTELMAVPDPPELKRGHRRRFEGRPDRYKLLPTLAMLFAQTRLIEFHERASYGAAVGQEVRP